jgi:hypothetical protein
MAKRDDEYAKEIELKKALKAMEPREWWLWAIVRRGHADERRWRAGTVMARWPYIRPVDRPSWGAVWPTTVLDHRPLRDAMLSFTERHFHGEERNRAARRIVGMGDVGYGASGEDASLGSMLCLSADLFGRGGPYVFLFTPPVYEFCNLEREFANIDDAVNPHDFWIQPEVYEATGEILQGSPVDPANMKGYASGLERGVPIQSFDSPGHEQYLGYVRIALDAFLQQGVADPRFIVSFAEKRMASIKAWESRCHFSLACSEKPTYMVRLPGMKSGEPMCGEHADVMVHQQGYNAELITPPKRNPHHDVGADQSGRIMRLICDVAGWRGQRTSYFSPQELTMALARDVVGYPTPGVVKEQRSQVDKYLAYFVDRDLVMKEGDSYAISHKALDYDDEPRWPRHPYEERTRSGDDATDVLRKILHSFTLGNYVRSFMDHPDAWTYRSVARMATAKSRGLPLGPDRVEIQTDASEYAIVVELTSRRDTPWPSISVFPVAAHYPIATPAPTDVGIRDRNFPRSPQEFAAMVIPLLDRFHP